MTTKYSQDKPKCTCDTFGNGVISGNDGRLEPDESCPSHFRYNPDSELLHLQLCKALFRQDLLVDDHDTDFLMKILGPNFLIDSFAGTQAIKLIYEEEVDAILQIVQPIIDELIQLRIENAQLHTEKANAQS